MKHVIGLAFLLASQSAHADTDVLVQAVNFALTARDAITVKVVDRNSCTFSIGEDIYYLNNVAVDRIVTQSWQTQDALAEITNWVSVELHGSAPIVETTVPASRDPSEELPAEIISAEIRAKLKAEKEAHPERYVARRSKFNERTLTLATSERARLERAWKYIYSHGCRGAKSPF